MNDSIDQMLNDYVYLELSVDIPKISDDYDQWAKLILKQKTWPNTDELENLNLPFSVDSHFILSLLKTFRLICELIKLPVFETPRVISFSKQGVDSEKYLLKIEVNSINFVPEFVYSTLIKFALKICLWMAKNPPNQKNKEKIYSIIHEQIVLRFRKLMPGGKSTIPVIKVAHSLGIPFIHLGAGVYQLGWGSKARYIDRSATERDSSIGAKLSQNKIVSTDLLRFAGLPVPENIAVSNEEDALSAASVIGFPLVIKPVDCERGEGVSVDIIDTHSLKLAFSRALQLSKSKLVIIERQVAGICHRLFIVNGKLLYAVKRRPMSIMADGKRSVVQLVNDEISAQKEKAPWERSEIQPLDERALKSISEIGLSVQSIPAEGVLVPLRRIESTDDGGVDEEVTTIVHADNLSAAIAASKLFSLHIAGIDMITTDISRPWYENGGIINEVNFAPLFGGAAISRSYIPKFFAEFINGDGKIPIEPFDIEEVAIARQKVYAEKGLRCYFTTPSKTLDFSGNHLVMPFKDIRQRLRALVCRSDVDAIVFVANGD